MHIAQHSTKQYWAYSNHSCTKTEVYYDGTW